MAGVNHKLVKQRLNEKRSKIRDSSFFSSRTLAGHFEDIAAAQTRRYNYKRRVRVHLSWKPKQNTLACTNNMDIYINCGNPFVTKTKGRENRYWVVCGMFAHELGHVLYTDFLAGQTYANSLNRYRWYPCAPVLKTTSDSVNERALWDYAKADPKNLEMLVKLAMHISNIIEDGYVENRIINNFPGTLGFGMEEFRKLHVESMSTVTQMIEAEDAGEKHIFESILAVLLCYSKFGIIKYGDESLSDERISTVFELLDDIDKALLTTSGKERFDVVNTILVRCWDYIEDFFEFCKKRQEEAEANGGTATEAETLSEILSSIAGSTEIGSGNTSPVAGSPSETGGSATAGNRAQTKSDAEESQNNASGSGAENESEEETENPQTGMGSQDFGDESGENNASPGPGDESVGPQGGSGGGKQETAEEETGRIPYHETSQLYEPVGGSVTNNEEYEREKYERAASDIERLLDKMAEKAACTELENERTRELNEFAQSIAYGDIHSGVNVVVNRIASVDEDLIEQYDEIAAPLLSISRQLQKNLVRQLEETRRGGKQTGLIMGRRLDSHALCRNDGKVFYKNALPNETPEIAVGLLLDESGSMSSADRSTYARATAIILYDFCQSLNIPIMVYGHTTGGSYDSESVELFSYAEFESFDRDDKYRLMDISARDCNRDGAALRYVAEQLIKQPADVKILFLVSDGQPSGTGYSGSAAEEDLRGIKKEYQRKGVLFVAAAIGSDKANIQRIYGDSYLDITDLNQLPSKFTNVVKRHLRV